MEACTGPWVQIEGIAEIVTLPEAMEPLVDYYRRLAGEHRVELNNGTHGSVLGSAQLPKTG